VPDDAELDSIKKAEVQTECHFAEQTGGAGSQGKNSRWQSLSFWESKKIPTNKIENIPNPSSASIIPDEKHIIPGAPKS
jgi:hypothetical protein